MNYDNNNETTTIIQTQIPAEYREAQYWPRGYVKPRKRKTALLIISLCLVCVILGGSIGIGTYQLIYALGGISLQAPENNAPAITPEFPAPNQTNLITTAPHLNSGYTGEVMPASQIYATVINSCVGITTPITTTNIFGQMISNAISGSGFIISEDGYIVTNYHVIETAHVQNLEIKVMLYNGEEYTARIIGTEPLNDVALLKIDAKNLTPVILGSLENMYVGDQVYAIGNPLGMLTWTMTEGIVSAFEREIGSPIPINMFQISAAINSGNSGGPVFNSKGEVIGIASAKYSSSGVEGLGFAIPIDDVRPMLDDFAKYGYVRGKAYFGITVMMTVQPVEGCRVVAVDDKSCAAAAGLRVEDIITKLDDYVIKSNADLTIAKKNYSAGDEARLTVYRDGKYLELLIVFDEERPSLT